MPNQSSISTFESRRRLPVQSQDIGKNIPSNVNISIVIDVENFQDQVRVRDRDFQSSSTKYIFFPPKRGAQIFNYPKIKVVFQSRMNIFPAKARRAV